MSEVTDERVDRGPYSLRFFWDEDAGDYANPREMDQLGTMVCWHPSYVLGDFQLSGDGEYTRCGAVDKPFLTESGRSDFRSMRQVERYLRLALGAVVVVPLYLYDHSGISMSAGAPNVFDNPVVRRDELGVGLGWDSSMVGFIYTTADRVRELCGEPQLEGDALYCPRTWPEDQGVNWPAERSAVEWVAKQLVDEVGEYDLFLRGEVYGYRLMRGEEELESCWGFLGLESVKQEGLASLELYVRDDERERDRALNQWRWVASFAPTARGCAS